MNFSGFALPIEERAEILKAMGRQMARRGPDDEQTYDDGILSLVFRRLSIIDVEGGRQPLWNENRSICAVINGEIYNHLELRSELKEKHTFRTRSDSEIVVHLYEEYGTDLLQYLNGMFAIMIWDIRKQCLFIARDRLGIKPLYYTQIGDTFLFASELKAMLVHPFCPKEFDWSGFTAKKFQTRKVPTYLAGVNCLPGGQYIVHKGRQEISPVTYWTLEDHFYPADGGDYKDPDYYIGRYGELLSDSVRKRLMSDVPVGLFLSGGADSVLLAAMAAEYFPNLHCFTVVERNTVRVGDVEQAYNTADLLNLSYHPVLFDTNTLLDQLQFSLEQFEYFIWVMESPRFDMEWFFKHELHRYAKTVVPELKVILLGQGADEFAGGYSKSLDRDFRDWDQYVNTMRLYTLNSRRVEMNVPSHLLQLLTPLYPLNQQESKLKEYHVAMVQYVYSLQRYNLWHEDRTSSAQGIESRVPFLDHRVVEMLASVPPEYHAELFFNKQILRKQFESFLPSYPKERAKVKFCNAEHDSNIASMPNFFIDLIKRIFPDFREKYLHQEEAIFCKIKMTELYKYITRGQGVDPMAQEILFECMAIEVFRNMCLNLAKDGPPKGGELPSPLSRANENPFVFV